jgi:hypothetical protein
MNALQQHLIGKVRLHMPYVVDNHDTNRELSDEQVRLYATAPDGPPAFYVPPPPVRLHPSLIPAGLTAYGRENPDNYDGPDEGFRS